MNYKEIQGVTALPENELTIPSSVQALLGITMFWNPQNHGEMPWIKPLSEDRKIAMINKNEKIRRGRIWQKVNAILAELRLNNTKENRKKIYSKLVDENPAKMEAV